MNKYELGVIVRADLEDEAVQNELNAVKALIERFGGTIDKIDDWGKRKLAYPIQKRTEGVYNFITITAESDAPREIESRLRIMENVLRFMMIRKDDTQQTQAVASAPVEEVAASVVAEPAAEEPAVEEPAEAVVEEVSAETPAE